METSFISPLPQRARLRAGTPLACAFALAIAAMATLGAPAAHAAADDYRYVTREGDTLIEIGERLLARPADWPRLQRANSIADPRRIPVGTVIAIPLAMMRADPVTGRVTDVQGEVTHNDAPIAPGAKVAAGDRLATGENGATTIELADGSRLTLQPSSRLRVQSLNVLRGAEQQDAQLQLERGRVESTVTKQRGPAPRFRIFTPTAAVGVRGTQFRVGADEAGTSTQAEVTQGKVAVGAQRREVGVPAGFGVRAAAGKLEAPVPLLAAPTIERGAALQERTVVRIAYGKVEGARAYRTQVATDADFRSVVSQALFNTPEAKFADLPDGNYYARVRAIDARGLEGKDADLAFRLKARPEPPFVSAPLNKGKMRAKAVDFAWAQAEGVATYRFQLAQDAGFGTPLISRDDLTANKLQSDANLTPGTYFWRVKSVRADGDAGPWGDVQQFELREPPATPEPPKMDDKNLAFAWSAEEGQTFEFQLARDEKFTQLVSEKKLDVPTVTLPKPDSGTYFMRVRATDPDGFVGPYTATQRVEVPPPKPWWLLLLLAVPFL